MMDQWITNPFPMGLEECKTYYKQGMEESGDRYMNHLMMGNRDQPDFQTTCTILLHQNCEREEIGKRKVKRNYPQASENFPSQSP